jgi:cytochrome P450 family 4
MDIANVYGHVIRAWIGHQLVVFLSDPRDVELILGSHVHIDKSDEYRFFKPWLGNGLLISTGEKWRTHRKLIAPAFHMNVLKSFMPTFNDNSKYVIKRLTKEVGKEFDCHDYMSEATVDILLETAMGSKRTSEDEEGFRYAMAVMDMCDILHKRQLQVFSRFEPFYTLTGMRQRQKKLLGTIHGMTSRVSSNLLNNSTKIQFSTFSGFERKERHFQQESPRRKPSVAITSRNHQEQR